MFAPSSLVCTGVSEKRPRTTLVRRGIWMCTSVKCCVCVLCRHVALILVAHGQIKSYHEINRSPAGRHIQEQLSIFFHHGTFGSDSNTLFSLYRCVCVVLALGAGGDACICLGMLYVPGTVPGTCGVFDFSLVAAPAGTAAVAPNSWRRLSTTFRTIPAIH